MPKELLTKKRYTFTIELSETELHALGILAVSTKQTAAQWIREQVLSRVRYAPVSLNDFKRLEDLVSGNIPDGYHSHFLCPRCGSGSFGTSTLDTRDWTAAVGHCHGFGCTFKWKRTDDLKYFILTRKDSHV